MGINIVLTGLMGAGKTTVGKLIAQKLSNYSFIDIDEEIEKTENMKIKDIFSQKSEEYFRSVESNVIKTFSQKENLIISIGGGAFESETNRENLFSNGKVFYLKASVDTLLTRVQNDTTRPLLKNTDQRQKLTDLLKIREKNYLKSDFIIDTENKTPNETADIILGKIK